MSTRIEETTGPGKAIYQLIVEARDKDVKERRADVRFPFFRPVGIKLEDGHIYSAFTREISEYGIGLIHNLEMQPGVVELRVASEQGYSIRVRTRILWCEACGEGWYISGGQFLGLAAAGA